MNLENALLIAGVVLALALLGAAVTFLRGSYSLRARLVVTFVALALVPALLSMVTLWRELQPQAWRSASRGVGLSMESAIVLARNVLADRHDFAREAAETALARLQSTRKAHRGDLADLLRGRYVAFFCAGQPGGERVVAAHGPWTFEQAAQLMRDVLPGARSGSERRQLIVAPDSTDVVVSVAGPAVVRGEPHYVVVALPVPEEEAAAIAAIVESYQRSQQLRLLEQLQLRHAGYFLAALAALFLVLAVTLGVVLARTLTRPIDRLQHAFEAVASGKLGHQVAKKSPGELGRLTEAFNHMSRDLHKSHEQLVRATRLAAWQDVARRLAHEIKNPLTPITLSIHRLRKRTAADDNVVRECLDTVLEETSHLERLANEFSSFARMPKPKLEKIDPADVLQQVLDLYSAHPGVHVRANLEGLPAVLADRDQIRQVFTNLVKNAVEAMPAGGDLEVHWARDNGHVAITFMDQGSGFPTTAGSKVFDPTFTTKPSGSGLGLAIVRRILEDHGGEIETGNRSEGGAWVRVRLREAV
ncbi:MAG: PAS domain-containing sensor histidine kinase [Candidatus Krumholzibacteriia bacterium]